MTSLPQEVTNHHQWVLVEDFVKEEGVAGDGLAGVAAGAGGNELRNPLRRVLATAHFYKGTNRSTTLYGNGKLVQELGIEKRYYTKDKTYNYVRTLVFPLQNTGAFKSTITNFKAKKL